MNGQGFALNQIIISAQAEMEDAIARLQVEEELREALVLDALDDYAACPRKRAGFEAPVSAAECPHRPTRGRHANRRIVRKLTWV